MYYPGGYSLIKGAYKENSGPRLLEDYGGNGNCLVVDPFPPLILVEDMIDLSQACHLRDVRVDMIGQLELLGVSLLIVHSSCD